MGPLSTGPDIRFVISVTLRAICNIEFCSGGYIIASSDPVPLKNKQGDNPPHAMAKARYEEVVAVDHFLCTGKHPDKHDSKAVVFEFTDDGFCYVEPEDESDGDESENK